MRLSYWVCEITDDSTAYNIRAKTKKEAEAMRAEYGADRFHPAKRVEVEYADGFELATMCLGEGRGYWEA